MMPVYHPVLVPQADLHQPSSFFLFPERFQPEQPFQPPHSCAIGVGGVPEKSQCSCKTLLSKGLESHQLSD